jgi:hypothetical protein
MVEEMGYQPRRNHNASAKAVVYLGGKSAFRKFLIDLRQAFKRYSLSQPPEDVKYEGSTRNGKRSGRGRLLFRNGMLYEGEFREGMRQGRGNLSLNGVAIYEGEWFQNLPSGEGYIKSMRMMSLSCSGHFQ